VFGRRPRLKTADQIVAELDQLRDCRVPTVFVVDDNLIGNKKAIKPLLRRVIEWQETNGYPFTIFTSLDRPRRRSRTDRVDGHRECRCALCRHR